MPTIKVHCPACGKAFEIETYSKLTVSHVRKCDCKAFWRITIHPANQDDIKETRQIDWLRWE